MNTDMIEKSLAEKLADGVISLDELKDHIKDYNYCKEEIEDIIAGIDIEAALHPDTAKGDDKRKFLYHAIDVLRAKFGLPEPFPNALEEIKRKFADVPRAKFGLPEPTPEQAAQDTKQEQECLQLRKDQQEQSKPTRGKGRPKETFRDKMIGDVDGKQLQLIHTKMNGKKGKDASLIILACIKKGWITKPTYTQVKDEFGDIGSKTGYNKYLHENMFTKEEIEGAINSLD